MKILLLLGGRDTIYRATEFSRNSKQVIVATEGGSYSFLKEKKKKEFDFENTKSEFSVLLYMLKVEEDFNNERD